MTDREYSLPTWGPLSPKKWDALRERSGKFIDVEILGSLAIGGQIRGDVAISGNLTMSATGEIITGPSTGAHIRIGAENPAYIEWDDSDLTWAFGFGPFIRHAVDGSGNLDLSGPLSIFSGIQSTADSQARLTVQSQNATTNGVALFDFSGLLGTTNKPGYTVQINAVDTATDDALRVDGDQLNTGNFVLQSSAGVSRIESNSDGTLTLLSGAAATVGIEFGPTGGSNNAYSTFIDFHNGGNRDFDARIIVAGGTGSVGSSILTISSGSFRAPAVYSLTTASGANVVVTGSAGELRRSTSSLRYKPGWEWRHDLADIELPQPITWVEDGKGMFGFGAEHLANVRNEFVVGDTPQPMALIAVLSEKIKQIERKLEQCQCSTPG